MQTYIKSELYASFIKKLRAQPYIAFRLFMLYAVTLERISSNELINGLLIPMFYLNSKSMGNVCGLDVHKDKYWKKVSCIAIILSEKRVPIILSSRHWLSIVCYIA